MTTSSNTESTNKSETAYRFIRDKINTRVYAPGHRLVLQPIASELGMSVVPVREAVRKLEAAGMVTFEPNIGARVAVSDEGGYLESMQALAVIEGAATALSARALTDDDIAQARAINEQMKESLAAFDAIGFTRLNREFHAVLFAPCPNVRMRELVEAEWSRLDRVRSSTFSFVPDRSPQSVKEHEELLRLIEDNAPVAKIEKAARCHRTRTIDAYLARQDPRPAAYQSI